MKEATSELNLTVVVVIIVAVLSLFFFGVLWPNIKGNFNKNTKCDEAICECPAYITDKNGNRKCKVPENGQVKCKLKDNTEITCTWKG